MDFVDSVYIDGVLFALHAEEVILCGNAGQGQGRVGIVVLVIFCLLIIRDIAAGVRRKEIVALEKYREHGKDDYESVGDVFFGKTAEKIQGQRGGERDHARVLVPVVKTDLHGPAGKDISRADQNNDNALSKGIFGHALEGIREHHGRCKRNGIDPPVGGVSHAVHDPSDHGDPHHDQQNDAVELEGPAASGAVIGEIQSR